MCRDKTKCPNYIKVSTFRNSTLYIYNHFLCPPPRPAPPHPLQPIQESKRSFITFHDEKALEPLVAEKWEDFNVKVNTSIPEILQWVSQTT